MGAHHGNEGTVKVTTNEVAEIQSWDYNSEDIDVAPVTSMGDTAETYLPSGIERGSGTVTCLWDESDTTGQGALVAGATVTLNLYPEGAATGAIYRTGSVVVESVSEKGGKTGLVETTFTFKGVMTRGTVA